MTINTTAVDVHVINMPGENVVLDMSKQAGVVVYEVEGAVPAPGTTNLMKNRQTGFNMGVNPYVSWADPDDLVEDNIYTEMAAVLDANPTVAGVFSNWGLIQDGKKFPAPYVPWSKMNMKSVKTPLYVGVHQVCVLKRSLVLQAYAELQTQMGQYPIADEGFFFAWLANHGGFIAVNQIGYWWSNNAGPKLSRTDVDIWRKMDNKTQETIKKMYIDILGK